VWGVWDSEKKKKKTPLLPSNGLLKRVRPQTPSVGEGRGGYSKAGGFWGGGGGGGVGGPGGASIGVTRCLSRDLRVHCSHLLKKGEEKYSTNRSP